MRRTDLPADRRAHKAPAALAIVAALAFPAGALAGPPQLTASNRNQTLDAALGSYEWCEHNWCLFADAFKAPQTAGTLPAHGGDDVRLRPHAKVDSIVVHTYAGEPYGSARRVDGRWLLRIRRGIGKRTDLLLGVRYSNHRGNAQWGFGISRAPQL